MWLFHRIITARLKVLLRENKIVKLGAVDAMALSVKFPDSVRFLGMSLIHKGGISFF